MEMTSPAAAAAEDRPRRKLYTQLWFWVLVAISRSRQVP
jgi:hypothetical protein